ncbi:MAG TPA: MBL fold metallo-hydrolase [Candidatus Aenigmarchaeota archaeon]|nr:MAG: MBL fold metallo-hydrolase [Candidatus Aenigmarchaeota archaeon]HDD45922.1 MBL fold metallo-hydrolase [Candidatus Aenigmarchaeota archaeon]
MDEDIIMIALSDLDSNIYIIGDTVIDTGTGFNFTRLYDMLKRINKSFDSFKLIINTHCHFDHIGGNGYFYNAKIAIHKDDATYIENADIKMTKADFFDGKLHPMKVGIKLNDGDELAGLKIMHTPGHTEGSVCIYDKNKGILFTGDTLFADGVGRSDLPGGDPQKLALSIERLSKLSVEKILPGHGEPVLKNASEVFTKILG